MPLPVMEKLYAKEKVMWFLKLSFYLVALSLLIIACTCSIHHFQKDTSKIEKPKKEKHGN